MDLSKKVAYSRKIAVPARGSSLAQKFHEGIPPPSRGRSFRTTISERTMAAKSKRNSTISDSESVINDGNCKAWDGQTKTAEDWNGLRRDPELWFPKGNCLVHLYGYGQSKRGPSFRVHLDTLLVYHCWPLLYKYMHLNGSEPLGSESGSGDDASCPKEQSSLRNYELYIPAPKYAERGQAFLYHTATRNFFAWLFGKPLVGVHLGAALTALLNSMNEFRSLGSDNVRAVLDYMEDEGYANMGNSPTHALAALFFAEHFQFKDLYTDAFAHCTGMHDKLILSAGFEHLSRTSRALITRSRMEMNIRLDFVGKHLRNFLADDLSHAHLGLSSDGQNHLDKFRTFLQSYYVAKLGYYPPAPVNGTSAAFPKHIYVRMCAEFQKLYWYLVDSNYTTPSTILPRSQHAGISMLQTLRAFDTRHKYSPLPSPLPLLPEPQELYTMKPPRSKRVSWFKTDKTKLDARVITFSSMVKATNQSPDLDCSLIRAYRGFEKDCLLPTTDAGKPETLSPTDGRKIRWILIYCILQTLISATTVPSEVRDTKNIPYNLCVLTAGTPPWKEKQPINTLEKTQTKKVPENFVPSLPKVAKSSAAPSLPEFKASFDHFSAPHRPAPAPSIVTSTAAASTKSRKSTIRRAISTLGNMPELFNPLAKRPTFHEILVHGYGDETNKISLAPSIHPPAIKEHVKKGSSDSGETYNVSSRWSQSSIDPGDLSSSSRRESDASSCESKYDVGDFLDFPESKTGTSKSRFKNLELQPLPLRWSKAPTLNKIIDEYTGVNPELEAYLISS